MEKRELLVKGKAKSMYATDDPGYVVMHFRDDTSAFDGKKVEQLERKGRVNKYLQRLYHGDARRRGDPDALREAHR